MTERSQPYEKRQTEASAKGMKKSITCSLFHRTEQTNGKPKKGKLFFVFNFCFRSEKKNMARFSPDFIHP
jgi:hypothetical protein